MGTRHKYTLEIKVHKDVICKGCPCLELGGYWCGLVVHKKKKTGCWAHRVHRCKYCSNAGAMSWLREKRRVLKRKGNNGEDVEAHLGTSDTLLTPKSFSASEFMCLCMKAHTEYHTAPYTHSTFVLTQMAKFVPYWHWKPGHEILISLRVYLWQIYYLDVSGNICIPWRLLSGPFLNFVRFLVFYYFLYSKRAQN